MEAAYYTLAILMVLLLFVLPVLVILFLINPELLNKFLPKPFPRLKILLTGIAGTFVILFAFGTALAITEPESVKQQRLAEERAEQREAQRKKEAAERERLQKIEAAKPKVRTETKKETVPFESTEQEDSSIPLGEKRVATEGADGERTITYEVTFVNGKETKRKQIKNEITKPAVTKIMLIGTYVKSPEPPAPTSSGGDDGYINTQGNYVPSPSSNPAGATARCADGTYSYSQSRRGTCSHHGGVAEWL